MSILEKEKIEPHKVTKPIQLLAAWLVGLIVIDSCFLVAAARIDAGNWERSALVVAAILNVPIFLGALFLLQTKFRPELQEDIFYSQYLDKKTDKVITLSKQEIQDSRLIEIKSEMSKLIQIIEESKIVTSELDRKEGLLSKFWKWEIAINDHLENFLEIKQELKRHGIPVKAVFGKIAGTKKPSKKIISFNSHMDYKSLLLLLRLLSKYDFEGYMYSDIPKEIDPEDIYIGSYGFDEKKIIPFSEELKKILKNDIDEIDLRYMEQKTGLTIGSTQTR